MSYAKYFYYIQKKDSTEYTGVESDISEKIVQEDISWFPRNRSISLGRLKEDTNSDSTLADKIYSYLKKLNNSMPNEEAERR